MVDPDAPADSVPLRDLLREDFDTYGRAWSRPGFHAIAVHRVGRRTQGSRRIVDRLVHQVAKALFVLVRNVYGIEVAFSVEVGRRVVFAHQGLIVVNEASRVGNDCLIRHGVSLGVRDDSHAGEAPVLEDHVQIGVNAMVIGGVVVGEGTKIGPGALLIHDVPPGSRVLASPAEVRSPGASPART